MPPRALKILKDRWAALAWVLFLTGVIGCEGSPTHARANTFESYDDTLYIWMLTYTPVDELSITAEGDVYTGSGTAGNPLKLALVGRATKEEMDTFVEIATRPATITAFGVTDNGCGMLSDGYYQLSLKLEDMPVYTHRACPYLAELQNQANTIRSNVSARARDAGGQ